MKTITTKKFDKNANSTLDTACPVSTTICACGNAKKASKPTCTLCSFLEYIKGTKDTIPTKICACGNLKKPGALCCSECDKALRFYLDIRAKDKGFNKVKFLESIRKNHGIGIAGKCSLCGGNYIFGGNNPQPVIDDYDARCCERCDAEIVLPARLNHIKKYGRVY